MKTQNLKNGNRQKRLNVVDATQSFSRFQEGTRIVQLLKLRFRLVSCRAKRISCRIVQRALFGCILELRNFVAISQHPGAFLCALANRHLAGRLGPNNSRFRAGSELDKSVCMILITCTTRDGEDQQLPPSFLL